MVYYYCIQLFLRAQQKKLKSIKSYFSPWDAIRQKFCFNLALSENSTAFYLAKKSPCQEYIFDSFNRRNKYPNEHAIADQEATIGDKSS